MVERDGVAGERVEERRLQVCDGEGLDPPRVGVEALSVGDFLSTVCPEQIVLREVRQRRAPAREVTEA